MDPTTRHGAQPPAAAPPATLERKLGLRDALAGTLSNIAPVEGIFIVTTLVATSMGTLTPWAFLVAAVGILVTGSNLAQFAARIPSAGGYLGFIARTAGIYGERTGVFAGAAVFLICLLAGPITLAAVLIFLGTWTAGILGLGGSWWLVIAIAAGLLSLPVLLRGVTTSARTSFLLFSLEAGGLLLFSAVVLFAARHSIGAPLHPAGGAGGWKGFTGITFALAVSGFVGWENSASLAEEVRNPRRVVPIATLTGIAVVAVLYLCATWAAVAGYAHWQGALPGMASLGNPGNATPFLDLADHYLPWFRWGVAAIGTISAAACLVAGFTATSRIAYASARAGLLPRYFATLNRHSVPGRTAVAYVAITLAAVVGPYLLGAHDPTSLSAYEAGIGTVPLIGVYLLVSVALPVYVLRRDRASFNPLVHLVPSVVGVLVIGFGIYGSLDPSQPAPGNTFWIYVVAMTAVAVLGAAVITRRNPRGMVALGVSDTPDDEDEPDAPSRTGTGALAEA